MLIRRLKCSRHSSCVDLDPQLFPPETSQGSHAAYVLLGGAVHVCAAHPAETRKKGMDASATAEGTSAKPERVTTMTAMPAAAANWAEVGFQV